MDTAVARPELLLVADAVAREKSIDREEVLEAMEQAIQKAGRAKYGHEKDIRATIDRRTGDVRLSRWTELVETVENEETQIPVHIAKKFRPDLDLGQFIVDPLPPIDFGRIAAQTAKQVIVQRVREYERQPPVRRVQGPRGRDHQRRGQAHRIRQPDGGSRQVRSAAAPRRADPARKLPQRRPRARLYLRRARGSPRAADLPVAHPSRLPGQAVRAGSAGNLRRHHRDQGGGARSRAAAPRWR